MPKLLQSIGFLLLFLRFSYWIGSLLENPTDKWQLVLLSELFEGVFLLLIFSQLVEKVQILPMATNTTIMTIGFLLVAVGTTCAILAKRTLGSAWVYAVAYIVKPRQQLVTRGIYSLVRHPIYSSIAISYIGIELLAGSWLWVSLCFLFIPIYFQARKEEKLLLNHFGEKYRKHIRKTKMLIPGIY